MRKHIKVLLGAVMVAVALFTFVLVVSAVNIPSDYGLGEAARIAKLDKVKDTRVLVGNLIGAALSMIGVLFFILMVYGGFLWMTARGDEGQTTKGRDTIIAAVIGLIIVLSSYAVTRFVFQSIGGEGGAPVSQNQEPADRCKAHNINYSCQNLANCILLNATSTVSHCVEDNACKKGLCPGGPDNVCCL